MTKNYQILLSFALACTLLLGGCAASTLQYFSYREESFCAELRGTLHALPFCAEITVEPTVSGYSMQIKYLGDPNREKEYTLEGLTVVAACSADGTPNGTATVTYQGVSTDTDGRLVADLLLPISSLLSPVSFATVQKERDGFRLGLEGGGELVLDGRMFPHSFSSSALSFSVVWWDVKN